ncbi:MAG: B12-binding domain-containing protein, partial [Planctomycetota bacterium]
MANEIVIERLFEALIDGDRDASNAVIEEQLGEGIEPESILENLLWPTYELVDTLYRSDKLTNISRSMAIRLLRVLADRFGERLSARPEPAGRTVLA